MKKDFVDFTPQELNAYLKKECEIDLFHFSILALENFKWKRIFPEIKLPPEGNAKYLRPEGDPWNEPQYCLRIPESEYINPHTLRGLRKQIVNLENKTITTLLDFEATVYGEAKPSKEEINSNEFMGVFLFRYGLDDFFGFLHYYERLICKLLAQKRSGAPVNRRSLLCACWVLYFLEKKKALNWILIADLLDWLWKRLEPYGYYHDFKPSQGQADPEYLKNQFFKQKKRWIKYYDAIRPWAFMDKGVGGAKIVVFGRNYSDLGSTYAYKNELSLMGIPKLPNTELWNNVHKIYSSRARFPRPKHTIENSEAGEKANKFALRANLNWLVVFPDGTYAIDPE